MWERPFTRSSFFADTAYEQEVFEVNAVNMLKDELSWLEEVRVPTVACPAFQTLLGGHLQLCRILFTCEGVNKVELGKGLA